MDDPVVDAEIFEKGIKRQFGDLKSTFREVVDNLRTNDYTTFVKVNESKAKQNQQAGAYNKLENELSKLKEQIDKAAQAKAMLSEMFDRATVTKNHTDARLKKSPGNYDEEYYDEEEDEEESEKVDFNDLYRKSLSFHTKKDQL
jgi:hypothetical protein